MLRRNLAITVALYFITGGAYAVYWFYMAGRELYLSNSGKRYLPLAMLVSVIGIVISTLFLIGFGADALNAVKRWFFLFALICVLLVYGIAFVIAKDLAKKIGRGGETVCSPGLAGSLTFIGFSSAIYLQSCINAQHKGGHAA